MAWKSLAEVVFLWVLQVGLLCIRNKTLSMTPNQWKLQRTKQACRNVIHTSNTCAEMLAEVFGHCWFRKDICHCERTETAKHVSCMAR